MARKGALKERTVYKMNVGLDQDLLQAVMVGSDQNERNYNQEVRFALRKFYGLDRTPVEDTAGVAT